MRALKILVVGLGIAVVIAFLTLVAVIINRGGRGGEPVARDDAARPPLRASWGRVVLDHAPGGKLVSVTASGNLIVLHVQGEAQPRQDRLVVVDPATGSVQGIFELGTR